MKSADLIKEVEAMGLEKRSQRGSHVKLKHPDTGQIVIIPHPKKDLPTGTVEAIRKQAAAACEAGGKEQ